MIKYIIASKLRIVVFLICILLFILPFFWLKPGEMDLGGDSNRLYFYDPMSSLKAFAIYSISPYGTSNLIHSQYFIPFLLFIAFLKSLFHSPTVVIGIFNGFKLAGSFIFMFLIIKELFRKEIGAKMTLVQSTAAILAAFFYTFSPSVIDNMKYALVTHSQVFLNPMIFYFLLRYLKTLSLKYIWLALLITFLFSSNFALYNPPLFAFYPLVIVFLLFYNFFILQKPIPWKGIIVCILFFLGLHAFHLFPVASNVFDKNSAFNARVFESTSKVNSGLEYFNAIRGLGKVSEHILLPLADKKLSIGLIIVPALIMLGFLSSKKKSKTLLLVSIFFFTTLFLVSANITQVGIEFYRKLFLIPGFGMFRGFFGQWQWVYTFFYALLAGLSIFYFFSRIRMKYIYLFSFLAIGFLVVRSWIVFNGEIVNVFHRGSNGVKVVIRMDPNYEKMLSYIKGISNDGKILHMPFTDYGGYNIVGGANRGVYIGQSMVSFLVGKNDFAGYGDINPFSEVFVKLVKERNYSLIKQMMSLLQIRYILYNSDEVVYDKFFPTFPYGYVGVPTSPSAALDFVNNISEKLIYKTGHYSLFEVDKKQYLPHFYVASEIYFYDTISRYDAQYSRALSFFPEKPLDGNKDPRIAFIDRMTCNVVMSVKICNQNNFHTDIKDMQIIYQRINPTKYRLEIKNVTKPFLLVFQDAYNVYWKLYPISSSLSMKNISDSYFDGAITELLPINQTIDRNPFETNGINSVYDNAHIQVNGYANAWYITPDNLARRYNYEFIAEMTEQKIVYYSLIVSAVSLIAFLLYGAKLLMKQKL